MRAIGTILVMFNFCMLAISDHWQTYAWIAVGLLIIYGDHYLAKR